MTGEPDPTAQQAIIEAFQASRDAHMTALREYVAEHGVEEVDDDGFLSIAMLAARLEQTQGEHERRDIELSALAILPSPGTPAYMQILYDGYLRIPAPEPHELNILQEKIAENALIGQRVRSIQSATDAITQELNLRLTPEELRFLAMSVSGIYLFHFQVNEAGQRDIVENLHLSIRRNRLGPRIGQLIDRLLQFDFSGSQESPETDSPS